MMNKLLKTILIILMAVFTSLFLVANFAQAQTPANIVVEIWDGTTYKPLAGNPIFNVDNFLPGETKTERIRVTNNTSESQTVGLKVKEFDKGCINSYCLADKLYLTVGKVGNSSLYSGSLTAFYSAGEISLSEVDTGGQVEYNLSVYFDKETAEKEYQGLITNFDLEIGFFTKETVSPEQPTGYGGYVPPIAGVVTTITIIGPSTVTLDSATISLTTDIRSYCRVIYDITSHPTLGNPPNYGYAFSTLPSDTKTTFHNITLTGLSPGTTYYYRAVCWASPLKISGEYSFTTLGVKVEELIPSEEEILTEEEILIEKEISVPEEVVGPPEEIEEGVPEEIVLLKEEIVIVPPERGLASVLAANIGMILGEISQSAWKMIAVTLCLIGLVLIGIREWERVQKKKKQI